MTVLQVLRKAADAWMFEDQTPDGVVVSEFRSNGAVGAAQRTGVGHYLALAAELSYMGETRIAAVWLCGATTTDAVMLPEQDNPACVLCHFSEACPRGPVVYRLYDEADQLLYIGYTVNAAQRLRSHSTGKKWWPEVARMDFERHPTDNAALNAESKAIREAPGRYNVVSRTVPGVASPLLGIVVETNEASA